MSETSHAPTSSPHGSARRLPIVVLLALLLLGAFWTVADRGQPLVRNSLVYARAAENVLEHNGDPRPVVADARLGYDKPIGYAWLSAPAVRVLGSHDGLRLTSFLGTAFFLLAAWRLARSLDPGLSSGAQAFGLALLGVAPIVGYQFWSAHPDSLFAALVLCAWERSHVLGTRRAGSLAWPALGLALAALAGLIVKNYALVLFATCPLYVASLRPGRRALLATAAAMAPTALFAWWAWAGGNPLARLQGEGGGVGQYGRGDLAISAAGTGLQILLSIGLTLNLAVLACFSRRAHCAPAIRALACFGLPYVAGLLPFPTSYYNMRYFLPVLALAAWLAARGWEGMERRGAQRIAAASLSIGLALAALFNVAPLYRRAAPLIPELAWRRGYGSLSLLDNLRMPQHLATRDMLESIATGVPPGTVLYMVDCFYYGDAMQGVYEGVGSIPRGVETRYVSRVELPSTGAPYFVQLFSGGAEPLATFGEVEALGPSLFHVRPTSTGAAPMR